MKNFVSIVLMISFSLGFITCARIDNSSVESTWLDEQLIEKNFKKYAERNQTASTIKRSSLNLKKISVRCTLTPGTNELERFYKNHKKELS